MKERGQIEKIVGGSELQKREDEKKRQREEWVAIRYGHGLSYGTLFRLGCDCLPALFTARHYPCNAE
jgi:hypothetical protein